MGHESRLSNIRALRIPPHSIEAEQAVLGGLMLSDTAWDRIASVLSAEDFYREDHRTIYRAIGDLKERSQPYDAVTLGEWFEQRKLAETVGGAGYVVQLANATPSAANIEAYAGIVREKSILRQLIDASGEISGLAFDPESRSSQEVLELAERKVFAIAEAGARGKKGFVTVKAAALQAWESLQKMFESKQAITGLSTGYRDLDDMTSGLQPAELIIIAARPSVGKTAFAMNIAEHAALASNRAVAIFSMEMSAKQLAFRLISSVGRINQRRLRNGDLEEEDWPRVTAALTQLKGARIFIDDSPALSPSELRAAARRLKRQHDIGLVVVDYLQLMQVPGNRENRATEISEISRNLKAMAKELDVPVIALSQLNRSLEQRPDKRPVMADLRESGAIEQDADVILFIYRDDYHNREKSEAPGVAEIIIGKQRNGPTDTVRLSFLGQFTRFENLVGEDRLRN
ncbi:replicative DNA helicase [Rudaea sp.]|uniref:replicative DNA helicase n=1 Tax=Rudaea sp. TaxID=2136325 RepID=UPI00378390BA